MLTIATVTLLTTSVPPDLLMLQETLDVHYDYPQMEFYSCPVPSVDHCGLNCCLSISHDDGSVRFNSFGTRL